MPRPLLLAVVASAALLASTSANAVQAKACDGPEYRQFDFWVGRWRVTPTGQDQVVAESIIEKLYDGCAIRENWMPRASAGGGSLNSYVPSERAWRQVWMDKDGSFVEFRGGWTGRSMVLTGSWPDGKPRLVRMTYTRLSDGSVRQVGQESRDGGRTWGPSFDFTYKRAFPLLMGGAGTFEGLSGPIAARGRMIIAD